MSSIDSDPYKSKIQAFFEKNNAHVLIKKIRGGYSLYSGHKNSPIARLRLTGEKDHVEVLWWSHRGKWEEIGDFGGIILPLDKAMKYVMDDPMGCLWL